MLEHHNSPLADQANTLYFASIDALSLERRRQLLDVLSEMEVCRRNRVIFPVSVSRESIPPQSAPCLWISCVASLFTCHRCGRWQSVSRPW